MPLIVLGAIFAVVLLGVILAFLKKAVFYQNFNDLAWSAGMCAIPALVLVIGATMFGQSNSVLQSNPALYVVGGLFVLLFIKTAVTTYKSNSGSLVLTPILMVGKTALSFLFIFYLYWSMTAKTRSERGKGMFVVVILTPIMLALVKEHKGLYAITKSGRMTAGKPVGREAPGGDSIQRSRRQEHQAGSPNQPAQSPDIRIQAARKVLAAIQRCVRGVDNRTVRT